MDEGCSYEQTALHELSEELGVHDAPLETLGTFRSNATLDDGRIINQFEHAYLARVPHGTALQPDPEEVSGVQWFTPAELKAQIARRPEAYTPGLLQALRMYFPD